MHNILVAIGAALMSCAAAVLFQKDATSISAPVALVTTAETVVVLGAKLPIEYTTCKCLVKSWCTMTPGTNTTAITLKLYRGTTAAGTQIGSSIALAGNFTVGSPCNFDFEATDLLANAGEAQYCMTVTQTGASANGSVTQAVLETEVLSG